MRLPLRYRCEVLLEVEIMSEINHCPICDKDFVGEQCPECGRIEDTSTLNLEQILDQDLNVQIQSVRLNTNQAGLVVLRGSTPGDTLILEGQRITVGRDASCDLFLDDITVSRKHAEIQSEEASGVTVWFVQDTDSLNGTYLNREVISQRTQLTSGDELQFGKFKFTFLLPEESE